MLKMRDMKNLFMSRHEGLISSGGSENVQKSVSLDGCLVEECTLLLGTCVMMT